MESIALADGRRLGFGTYGTPDGIPVFGFFGAGARYLRPPDAVTTALGVRLITVERPGLGLSTFQPKRTLLDWPSDVAALADALGIERFAVVGASQGGPYAAACAFKLPARLMRVGLVSSLAPFQVPGIFKGMALSMRLFPILGRRLPRVLIAMQNVAARMAQRDAAKLIRRMFRGLPEVDQAVWRDYPEFERIFVQDAAEIYRQGGRGTATDVMVVSQPWGFRLGDIQAPVIVWQGENDPNVPVTMGRYLARTIPKCEATFVAGAGHFMMYSHWEPILKQLIAA